jgi:hypothetical protein
MEGWITHSDFKVFLVMKALRQEVVGLFARTRTPLRILANAPTPLAVPFRCALVF